MVEMVFNLSVAEESDCQRIATIHMAAFEANAMLQAQFPTPSTRERLKICIAQKALDDIRDIKIAVLVVRDSEGKIVSFAKWSLPIFEPDAYVESPWFWPEGTDFVCLEAWAEKVESAKLRILGGRPCYRKY